eukprot:1159250-Pelagomonas_calceolata.AAC.6
MQCFPAARTPPNWTAPSGVVLCIYESVEEGGGWMVSEEFGCAFPWGNSKYQQSPNWLKGTLF